MNKKQSSMEMLIMANEVKSHGQWVYFLALGLIQLNEKEKEKKSQPAAPSRRPLLHQWNGPPKGQTIAHANDSDSFNF